MNHYKVIFSSLKKIVNYIFYIFSPFVTQSFFTMIDSLFLVLLITKVNKIKLNIVPSLIYIGSLNTNDMDNEIKILRISTP